MEDVLYLREHGEEQRYVFSVYSESRDLTRHPDPQEYVVRFDQPFKNVVGLDVVEALIPRSQYLIDVHNNTLLFTQTGSRLDIQVPVGEYDRTTLVEAMNAALSPHGIRARFQSRERSVIEFASARVFKLDVLRSTMARFLGFRMQQDYVNFTLVRGPSERPEITQAVALYWKTPGRSNAETHGDVLFEDGTAHFPVDPPPDTRAVLDTDALAFAFTLPQPFQLPEDFRFPRYRTLLESGRVSVSVGPRSVRVRLFRPFDPEEENAGGWTVPTEPLVPVRDSETATYVFHGTTQPVGNDTWGELVPSDLSFDPDELFGDDGVTASGLRITYVDHPMEWTSEGAYNHAQDPEHPTPVSFRMHWTYAPTVGTLPLFRYGTAESFVGVAISDGKAIYERRNTVDVTRTSTLPLRDPINVPDSFVVDNERYEPRSVVPVSALYVEPTGETMPESVAIQDANGNEWTGTWDGVRVLIPDDGPVSIHDTEGALTVIDAEPPTAPPFVIHHLQLRTRDRIPIPAVGTVVSAGFGAEERSVVVCNASLAETGANTTLDVAFSTDRFETQLLPDRVVVGDRVVPLVQSLFFTGSRQLFSVYADRTGWTDAVMAQFPSLVTGISVDGTEGFLFVANAVRTEPISTTLVRIDVVVQIGPNAWPGLRTNAHLRVGGHDPLPLLVDPLEPLRKRAFLVSYAWELEGRAYTRVDDRPKPEPAQAKEGALRQPSFRVPVRLDFSNAVPGGTDSLDGTPLDAWSWHVALDAWDPRLDRLLNNRLALEGQLDVRITTEEPQIRRRLLVSRLDARARYETRLWIDLDGTVHVQVGGVYETDPVDAFRTVEGLREARIRVPLGSDMYATGPDTVLLETLQARLSADVEAPMDPVERPDVPADVTGAYVIVIHGSTREVVAWSDFDPQTFASHSVALAYALVRPNEGGRGYLDRVWENVPVQRKHAVGIFSDGEVWFRNGLTNERVVHPADAFPPQSLTYTPWLRLGRSEHGIEDLTVATGEYVRAFWDDLFDSSDRSLYVYSQPVSKLGNVYRWNLIPSSAWSIVRIGEVSQRFVLEESNDPSVLRSITLFLADRRFIDQQIPLRVQLFDALGNALDDFLELVDPETPTDRITLRSDDDPDGSMAYGFPDLTSITFSFDRYKTGAHVDIVPGVPYTVAVSFNFPDSGSLAFEAPVFPPTTDFLGTVRALLPTGRFQDQRGYVPMRLITERLEHRIVSPGITMMTSGTFVKLSVPEIESYAYQHQNYDDRAPGIASFFLAKEFEHQWFEFPHTSSTKDLRVPIASVDRLTLRFLTETDAPYQFRGVDHILKLTITFLVPRVDLNFPSRLAPHYAPGRILFANSRDTDAEGDGPVDIRPYDPTDDLERRHDLDGRMVRREAS